MHAEILSCLSLIDRSIVFADFKYPEFALGLRSRNVVDLAAAEKIRNDCRMLKAEILHPAHVAYPSEFSLLEKPPLFMSLVGSAVWKERPCLSIVGSREPKVESLEWMDIHLAGFLKRHPKTVVVSGGARGIDRRAHLCSLRAELPTVVFLPSGIGNPYPNDIREFFEPVIESGGAIVSPFSPFQEVRKRSFEDRNRLIAAMGSALFVVEGRRRSGSLMTARLAIELGREVAVLPGFPGDRGSAGVLDLLCDGATPIRDEMDLSTFVSR